MELYVIESVDGDDNEVCVLGVASDTTHARRMIAEYYGEGQHTVIGEHDIRDSGVEFTMTIEWEWDGKKTRDTVIVRSMMI